MPIDTRSLTHRLIGVRTPYRLERVGVDDLGDATYWMRWWCDVDPLTGAAESPCIWFVESPARVRAIAADWLRLRRRHLAVWRQRGGADV